MSENLSSRDFLLDKRIVNRNIKTARLEQKEYLNFVASLPDLANECEDISEVVFDLEHSKVALTGDYVNADIDNE